MPRIDQIVDSTAGCELLSFLDAYSGYLQIKMKESDQLVTFFITPFGMYCYVTMPFGLRNAGATYQRCMLHVFRDHIGRTIEAYVDDIVVKSRKADDLVADLKIAFDCLRAKGVKLLALLKYPFYYMIRSCFGKFFGMIHEIGQFRRCFDAWLQLG